MSASAPAFATAVVTTNPVDGTRLRVLPGHVGCRHRGRSRPRSRRLPGVGSGARCRPRGGTGQARHPLRARSERYAAMVTAEMGKPLAEAVGRWRSRRPAPSTTPTRPRGSWLPRTVEIDVSCRGFRVRHPSPWASCWPSCRGTSPSGRSSVRRSPASSPATVCSSSTPLTSPGAMALAARLFVTAGFPAGLVTTLVVTEPRCPARSAAGSSRTRGSRRHVDRQQRGRGDGRGGQRAGVEEVRAGARRVRRRSWCWPMPMSTAAARAAVNARFTKCRAELHLREAVHRGGPVGEGLHRGPSSKGWRRCVAANRRDPATDGGPTRPWRPAGRPPAAGRRVSRRGARLVAGGRSGRRDRGLLRSQPSWRTPVRACRCSTRRPSARWPR